MKTKIQRIRDAISKHPDVVREGDKIFCRRCGVNINYTIEKVTSRVKEHVEGKKHRMKEGEPVLPEIKDALRKMEEKKKTDTTIFQSEDGAGNDIG